MQPRRADNNLDESEDKKKIDKQHKLKLNLYSYELDELKATKQWLTKTGALKLPIAHKQLPLPNAVPLHTWYNKLWHSAPQSSFF